MTELLDRVFENWDLLTISITSTALVVWAVAQWGYRTRHENQQSHIALLQRLADDYKSKLGGASPDDARARVDELERRLGPPYPLTQPQQDRLTSALTRITPAARFPVFVMSPVDAAQHDERMKKFFEDNGWTVTFQATPFMSSEASGTHVLTETVAVSPHRSL